MEEDDVITIGLVAHLAFCPRRAWLEAAGEKTQSHQMEVGLSRHVRVDSPENSRSHRQVAIDIHSARLRLQGRCDVVEETTEGLVISEQKSTPVRRRAEVTFPQHMQVVLQAICLEDMGRRVAGASIWFVDHKQRITVDLGQESRAAAEELVHLTRRVVSSPEAPDPFLDDPRCKRCSHASVCMPDELRAKPECRSISVADPDSEIVHINSPGARVHLKSGRLMAIKGDEELASVPIERVGGLVVYGNVDISGAALRELMWRDRSVVWCSGRGRVVGWTRSAGAPNGRSRARQGFLSEHGDLSLGRAFISAKIENSRVLLRRSSTDSLAVKRLAQVRRAMSGTHTLADVLGLEGEAASLYFQHFPMMFKGAGAWLADDWQGRSRRPALDALNCTLNFLYGLLLVDSLRSLLSCGLDPSMGFLHSSSRNKPALALDLMEEFRAPVADSVAIRAANNGELDRGMFSTTLGDARLTERGRRCLIRAYEERIGQKIRHPQFGYEVTWRRCIEVQARMLLGVIDGVRPFYHGMVIR